MKKIMAALAGSLLIGVFAASYAKLPAPTPEEKAAAAAKSEKDAAAKAKAAKELGQAQDEAVANYRKKKGSSIGGAMAPHRAAGADHSTPTRDSRNPAGR
jgi:hypothetical protein